MPFLGLDKQQRKLLEFEVVPKRARLLLTRLLRHAVDHRELSGHIARMNNVVNICRNVLGLPINIIELTENEEYEFADGGWLKSELEVAMRRPDTDELIETLGDLIQEGWLETDSVNEILGSNGCAVSFDRDSSDEVEVEITPVEEIEADNEEEIPNIRLLIRRMDTSLEAADYAAVLHASASVFETLAKDIVALSTIQDKTLASFFDRYRKDSKLPEPVLDYILETYRRRNSEPLAGHGQLKEPTIKREEAVVLTELTKAFVRIERQLSTGQVNMVQEPKS